MTASPKFFRSHSTCSSSAASTLFGDFQRMHVHLQHSCHAHLQRTTLRLQIGTGATTPWFSTVTFEGECPVGIIRRCAKIEYGQVFIFVTVYRRPTQHRTRTTVQRVPWQYDFALSHLRRHRHKCPEEAYQRRMCCWWQLMSWHCGRAPKMAVEVAGRQRGSVV